MVRIVHGYHGHESFHGGSEGTFAAYDDNGKLCGFGGVEIRQGYDPGEFSGLQGFGVYPSPDSSDALSGALANFDEVVNAYKSKLEGINASLYSAAQAMNNSASMAIWQSWHNSAANWENYAGTITSQLQQLAAQGILTAEGWAAAVAQDASGTFIAEFPNAVNGVTPAQILVNDFAAQGVAVAYDARSSMTAIRYDDSLSSAITEVAEQLPGALISALNAILSALGGALVNTTWQLSKVVLIATAAVAAGLYLLRRFGGLSGNYGPVKAASYNGYSRRRKRRR